MNLNEFKTLLDEHTGKTLTFKYTKGGYVDPDFHITEIKKCAIEAVNCGGGTEYWDETIIQLYENPYATEMGDPMTTKKALEIIQRVEKERPLIHDSLLRFEYGNQKFHTCIQSVSAVTSDASKLVVSLGEVKADCKDKEACGISVTPDRVQEKVKCAPGSGCC
jgi:hypothetical protein